MKNKSITRGARFYFPEHKLFKKVDIVFISLFILAVISLIIDYIFSGGINSFTFTVGGITLFLFVIYINYRLGYARSFIITRDYVEFQKGKIVISENNKQFFNITEIKNIKIHFHGIDDYNVYMLNDLPRIQGNMNFLQFDFDGNRYTYEFFIRDKRQTQQLKKILMGWKENNIIYKVIKTRKNG